MTRKRFATSATAAIIVSQMLAVVVHGFILAKDYAPFHGTGPSSLVAATTLTRKN
jgi:hypothetical protein